MSERKKCDKCSNVADVVENDVFYSCAVCWLKVQRGLLERTRRHEQSTVHRKTV